MRIPPIKYFLLVGILFVLLAVFLVSKDKVPGSKSSVEVSLPQIKISSIGPGGFHGILTAMKEHEFDAEEGFLVEERLISSQDIPNVTTFLMTGEVDVGIIPPIQLALVRESGNDIKIIAPAFKLGCPFIVQKNSEIKDWRDLEGKKLGILAPTSGTYQSLKTMMNMVGVTMEDYFKIEVLPFPSLISAVALGRVDASIGECGMGSIPLIITSDQVKSAGYNTDVINNTEFGGGDPQIQLLVLASTKDWIKANPNFVKSINKAVYRTFNYLSEHPDELRLPYLKEAYVLENDEQVDLAIKHSSGYFYHLIPWNQLQEKIIEFLNSAYQAGILSVPPDSDIFAESE